MEKLITVLMSVYNEDLNILEQSISSIMNQSYKNFGFMIVLDNPDNDKVKKYLFSWAEKDNRIKILINEKNLGLPMSLNKGIDQITTKYIARMDADDIAFENRLEDQLAYMIENPTVDLLGTNVIYMKSNGDVIRARGGIPEKLETIKNVIKYANVFNHPTLMGKTEVFRNVRYRDFKYSQDYDFICRLIELGYVVENLNKPYLYYRLADNVSVEKIFLQKYIKNSIQKLYRAHRLSIELDSYRNQGTQKNINMNRFKYEYNIWKKMVGVKKRYSFDFFLLLVKIFLFSKFYRKDLVDLIIFSILKKIYKF